MRWETTLVTFIGRRSAPDELLTGRPHFSSLCLTWVTHIAATSGAHASAIWSPLACSPAVLRPCFIVLAASFIATYSKFKQLPLHDSIFCEDGTLFHFRRELEHSKASWIPFELLPSPTTSNLSARMCFIFTTQIFTYIHTNIYEYE